MKAPTVLFSLLVVFTMILTACGGTDSQGNKSGPKNTTLTVVPGPNGDFTRNFNPYAQGNNVPGPNGLLYETLLYFNNMDGSIKPWLATGYKFSDDAKSLTFTIRQGVKWSDGKPMTIDDVLFSFNILKKFAALDQNNMWSYIQDIAKPDANTLTITLKQPFTPVLYFAGRVVIVPQSIFEKVDDPVKFTNPDPVATGPYLVKNLTPQLVAYKKNPNYWQPGKPEIEEIHYPSYNSNTSVELDLNKGDIDMAGLYTPKIEDTYVKRDPKNHHYWFPAGNTIMLYLNLTKYPFDQLAVRQAISAAINRDQISTNAESGYVKAAHPSALVLPNNQSFMASEYANLTSAQDVSKAQSLMSGLGLTKGSDGIYVGKDGKPFTFNLGVVTGWTDWVTACQIIASDLEKIGIKANVTPVSFSDYFTKLQMGTFDMSISWTNSGPNPFYLYNDLLNSAKSADVGKAAATNWARWRDAGTDKLLDQFASTTDEAKQKQAIAGLQKVMVDQVPAVPLFYGPIWYEYNTKRFTGFPNKDNPYANPAPFTWPDSAIVIMNLKSV
jgi:peptide/nickel transport system substrate-binding protein